MCSALAYVRFTPESGHVQCTRPCLKADIPPFIRLGRSLSAVWLSPNARHKPPSDPRGVIRIARKLYPQNSVVRDGAIEQKRHAEDHNERGREPRSKRGSACRYDQNPSGVSGMADEGVGPGGDHVLAAVGLDAND